MNDRIRKGAGIAAIVLLVGGGAYMTGAGTLGACDAKAKASKASATSASAATCEKAHASAMVRPAATAAQRPPTPP